MYVIKFHSPQGYRTINCDNFDKGLFYFSFITVMRIGNLISLNIGNDSLLYIFEINNLPIFLPNLVEGGPCSTKLGQLRTKYI